MGGTTARSRVEQSVMRLPVPTSLPDAIFPWTGMSVSSADLQDDQPPPRSQREAFAVLASRLDAVSALVRELGTTARPTRDAVAAAELAVRRVAATAEALMAQFAPPQAGGLALVVPRRSHAFRVARSTNCLPAFMPSETCTDELSYVSGSGSVQPQSLDRPEADIVPDAETCAAIAVGLQLATAAVTAALCDFGTALDSGLSDTPSVPGENSSSKRARLAAPTSPSNAVGTGSVVSSAVQSTAETFRGKECSSQRTGPGRRGGAERGGVPSLYRKACPKCGRVFTHPPALSVHAKSCGAKSAAAQSN